MDDEIEKLAEELDVGDDFEFGIRSSFAISQGWEKGDPATIEQLERFSAARPHQVASTHFSSDNELIQMAKEVKEEWPSVEVLFGGSLGPVGYVDAMFLVYEDVVEVDEFEEYCVLRFKSTMRGGKEDNRGIDPVEDERITFSHERFRQPKSDEYLLVSTSEFQFKDQEFYGNLVRLWWDD